MTELNFKLLNDLARLAVRYEPGDWEQLAISLEDPVRRQQVRKMLLELASVSRSQRKQKPRRATRPGPTSRVRNRLSRMRVEDGARAELLEDIWVKLRERELLPTIATVRAFADAIGLKGIKSTRRDQAVTELMEHLIDLPGDALEQRMRQTVVTDRNLGDEYERWVQLILRRPSEASEKPTDGEV